MMKKRLLVVAFGLIGIAGCNSSKDEATDPVLTEATDPVLTDDDGGVAQHFTPDSPNLTASKLQITLAGGVAEARLNWSLSGGVAGQHWRLRQNSEIIFENAVESTLPQMGEYTARFTAPGEYEYSVSLCDASDHDEHCAVSNFVTLNVMEEDIDVTEGTDENCPEKSFAKIPTRADGRRFHTNFPTTDGVTPGSEVTSGCIRFMGLEKPLEISVQYNKGSYSINDGAYTQEPGLVRNGDRVRLRTVAPSTEDESRWLYLVAEDGSLINWIVRAANDDREPMLFRVGPQDPYRELSEVAPLIRAGDIIEVQGASVYAPVEFRRAGLPDKPVIIRGISKNGQRPVIEGGSVAMSLRGAHHYVLENLEIRGGTTACLRNEANNTLVLKTWVHDCPAHGVLGTDLYSGSLILRQTEVSQAGNTSDGGHVKHGIYVATDRDRYPGSVLRVESSYLHDIKGDAIKSRAERVEVYYNWIELADDAEALYSLELLGYEEYATDPSIHQDVVGNVLVHHRGYGVRLGGDGTGTSRGRVRMVNNTLLMAKDYSVYTPVIRLYQSLDSLFLANNVFTRMLDDTSSQQGLRLFRNDIAQDDWVEGKIKLVGYNNWLPAGSEINPADAALWSGNIMSSMDPSQTDIVNVGSLDITLSASSSLKGSGTTETQGPEAYLIDKPLLERKHLAPFKRPASGTIITVYEITDEALMNIGAH